MVLAGQLLAIGAVLEGKQSSFLPSYGPEMRGGIANCTVVVSDERIVTPLSERPGGMIAFNEPSFRRFAEVVAPGGFIIVNSSLVEVRAGETKHARIVPIPLNDLAQELGSDKVGNMIALGAYLELTGAVGPASVLMALESTLSERKKGLLPMNERALALGRDCVKRLAAQEMRINA